MSLWKEIKKTLQRGDIIRRNLRWRQSWKKSVRKSQTKGNERLNMGSGREIGGGSLVT